MSGTTRLAAVQLEVQVGDVDANLASSEKLIDDAAAAGASWIVLPEFFSTGVGNLPELAELAAPLDGEPTSLLRRMAARYGIHVGGSALVRSEDGHVRNAFVLAGPDGMIVGRHEKDIPTMWEGSVYVGGNDPGVTELEGGVVIGVALCWELIRTETARRIAGKVDLVLSGSGWWSFPQVPPKLLTRRLQESNERRALAAPAGFAPFVGAPLIHAALSGELICPWLPNFFTYRGYFQGGAMVCDADGQVLAMRRREEGSGFAVADVSLGRQRPTSLPNRFWLQRRGVLGTIGWTYQNALAKRRYRSNS